MSMGFPNNITKPIINCVMYVLFSISTNWNYSSWFKSTIGIIQGDHLSPYLFILYAEGVFGLLINRHNMGSIHGLDIEKKAPTISHIFFIDDNVIFFRTNEDGTRELHKTFKLYQHSSGQLINYDKSVRIANSIGNYLGVAKSTWEV